MFKLRELGPRNLTGFSGKTKCIVKCIMHFQDHFSKHAGQYARARPHYPPELFEYLSTQCAEQKLAWDCGTGNGQAALGLAPWFEKIIATDASAEQLEHALTHPKIEYRQAHAERSAFPPRSFDLIVAAQALHWFDIPAFFAEARKVLKERGLLAVWSYELSRISPAVDAVVLNYYADIIGPDWPPERRLVADGYRSIEFPFTEMTPPEFRMQSQWNRDEYLDYLYSWSATQRHLQRTGRNPLELIYDSLSKAWGKPETKRTITWPLNMRIGNR
jgi:ubiquinone/menaquinone biosynthesis C-methylase UbiE